MTTTTTYQLQPGIYRQGEDLYKVQPNQAKTKVYAKKLTIIHGERLNIAGDTVKFDYSYAPGVIFKLAEGDRLTKAEAEKFGIQYGHCLYCGRKLKAATSVERSIGPICFGKFA